MHTCAELAFLSLGGAGRFSVEYEHMFAFGSQKRPVRPRPGSSRPDWPTGFGRPRRWPVGSCRYRPPLAPLFPDGALRRGTTTTVVGSPGHGATTLALALLAAASQAGSWCAAVGLPDPGVVAAAELGVDLRRVVFVPHPGSGWAEAAGDLLLGRRRRPGTPARSGPPTAARHLSARARERQAALVVLVERRRRLARGRRPGALGGSGRVGGRRPRPRPPAGAPGRGAGQRATRGRPGQRVLAVAARRLGGGGRTRGSPGGRGPATRRRERTRARGTPGPATGRRRPEGAVERRGTVGRHLVPRAPRGGSAGEEARRFAHVLARAGELCPWVHPVRLGVCALPARGPARFFGGEEAVVAPPGRAPSGRGGAQVGVADGLFAALLAARSELIVPAGGTADFLGALVGGHAGPARPGRHLAAAGGHHPGRSSPPCPSPRASRTASGPTPPPATRWPVARAGNWPGCATAASSGGCGWPGARIPTGAPTPPPHQPGFFGGASEADTPGRPFLRPGPGAPGHRGRGAWAGCAAGATRPASRCWCPGAAPRPGAPARAGAPWPGRVPPAGPDPRAAGAAARRGGRRARAAPWG